MDYLQEQGVGVGGRQGTTEKRRAQGSRTSAGGTVTAPRAGGSRGRAGHQQMIPKGGLTLRAMTFSQAIQINFLTSHQGASLGLEGQGPVDVVHRGGPPWAESQESNPVFLTQFCTLYTHFASFCEPRIHFCSN